MRRCGRILNLLGAVLLVVTSSACGNDGSEPAADRSSTRPTATGSPTSSDALVDIGDRSLFMTCTGSESPTVVLEAGLTGDHRTWDQVMATVPPDQRLCAYDRANIGSSDPAPTPRTAQEVVDDLSALLAEAGEEPPYVLVGHSFGGIFVQLYAAQHPTEVVGLVLVESNHPDEARQFEAHLTPRQIAVDREMAAENPEGIDIYGSFDQVRSAGPMPDVPLVVVTATRNEGWPPGWDPAVFDRLRARQQTDLVNLVADGRQMIAEGSGHHVPSERPDVVLEAILDVLSRSLGN